MDHFDEIGRPFGLCSFGSRRLRIERPDIQRKDGKDALGSPYYLAARCGGTPISVLREYVEQQKTPV